MKVTKAGRGKPYEAAKHYGCWGAQYISPATGSQALTLNLSYFLPNGGAEMSAGPERAYYVLSGSITVRGKAEEHVLSADDVIYIGTGEERAIAVNGQEPASLLVVIVTPG